MASTAQQQQQPLALFSSSAVSSALSPSSSSAASAYQQQQQQQQHQQQNCIYSAYIINKAGGLIFHYQQQQTAINHPKLTSNELLVLAGTFHGIHVISSKLQPLGLGASTASASTVPSAGVSSASAASSSQPNSANQGITHLLADTFQLLCHQSRTGVKFLLTASPQHPDTRRLWAVVGERLPGLYADWAMKNPFYQPEMPVRCQLFDREVQRLFADEVLPL